jgi:hypothetical protein
MYIYTYYIIYYIIYKTRDYFFSGRRETVQLLLLRFTWRCFYFCVTSTEGQKLTRQDARGREYAGASFTLLY